MGEAQLHEPAWGTRIAGREALTTDLLGERPSNPGFPDPGGAEYQAVQFLAGPFAGARLGDERMVEARRGMAFEAHKARAVFGLGLAQAVVQAL